MLAFSKTDYSNESSCFSRENRGKHIATCQSGQAAVIGVIGLLVLSLGFYTSYNISRAVAEKIELQNITDATAYSLAAMEARTFNFVAFANRCQIAHYVAAMSYQSLISWTTYNEALMGFFAEMVIAAGASLYWATNDLVQFILTLFSWIPPVAAVKAAVVALHEAGQFIAEEIGKGILNDILYEAVFKNLRKVLDGAGIFFQYLLYIMNYLYYFSSMFMVGATALHLASGGRDFVSANDGRIHQPAFVNIGLGALNEYKFLHAIDFSTAKLLIPSSANAANASDKVKEAQVVMTELINATRYDRMLVDRIPGTGLNSIANTIKDKVLNQASTAIDNSNTRCVGRNWFERKFVCKDINDEIDSGMHDSNDAANFINNIWGNISLKMGQTKLVSAEVNNCSNSNKSECIKGLRLTQQDNSSDNATGTAQFSRGTALVALDSGKYPFGGAYKDSWTYGVYSSYNHSYHCVYTRQSDWKTVNVENPLDFFNAFKLVTASVLDIFDALKERIDCSEDQKKHPHPWWGIQPYVKFRPDANDRTELGLPNDFNQPDVFIWLVKDPEDMRMNSNGGSGRDMNIRPGAFGGDASFESDIGRQGLLGGGFSRGINAIARAQTYYHRPGVWREHPNFFNPFWRARLAPVSGGFEALIRRIPNETLREMATGGIVAH